MADSNSVFSTDIYEVSSFINDIKKNFVEDVNEETLYLSTFGFMGAAFQEEISNTVRIVAENANEPFPTRAKYDTNVYCHAINNDIIDLNAVPASFQCRLGFLETELLKVMTDNTFIIDRKSSFFVENIEFHLEYDVILRRTTINTGGNEEVIYTAQYDFSEKNELSSLESPYIDPPNITKFSGDTYVWVTCILRQYTINENYKKIITNNPIDNKTVEFEYSDQLANFTIQAFEDGKTINLTPTYDGKPISDNYYAYYEYLNSTDLDSSIIRVKFDRSSYEPPLNSEVLITTYTTLGFDGNFSYNKDYTLSTINSDKYKYRNIPVLIWPISDSIGGKNRKSIKELRQIIPKEAIARGSITSMSDLEGYFNRIDSDTIKTKFFRNIDNQKTRRFSSYLLMKKDNVVIPTNTISAVTKDIDYTESYNGRYVVRPGQILFYRNSSSRATFITKAEWEYWKIVDNYIRDIKLNVIKLEDVPEEYSKDVEESIQNNDNHFYYGTPFTMIINEDPQLYLSYYLMIMNKKYSAEYNFVNNNSVLQFIISYLLWERKYTEIINGEYVYHGSIKLTQNIAADMGVLKFDEPESEEDEPEIIENNLMVVLVIYNDNHEPIGYTYGHLTNYVDSVYGYEYQFDIRTDDVINEDNHIRLLDIYEPGGDINGKELKRNIFVNYQSNMEIFVLCKFVDDYGNLTNYGLGSSISKIVPGIDDYSLLNTYTVDSVQFFTNYTHIVTSSITSLPDIIIKEGTNDDKDDDSINAVGVNIGSRDLYPNQYDRWEVNGRDIITEEQCKISLNEEDSMLLVINRSPDTILRYNSKGDLIDFLRSRECDDKENNTWFLVVYGISNFENTRGLYRYGDSTYLAIHDSDIVESYIWPVKLTNSTLYCDEKTNFGTNADWPKYFNNQLYGLSGKNLTDYDNYPLRIKGPNDFGSIDYDDPGEIDDTPNYISYTNRFYIKSIPVIKFTYINDESRITDFISLLEQRREYINSALYVVENSFGIDLKFFNTYGPSKTFYLNDGNPLSKTNIVFKFKVKLQPGADKYTKDYIILAIKDYIENLTQYDNTHISLLIKQLNNQFKESTVYIDYEGFDEFGPEQKHINRIESSEIFTVPEFINISSNDDLTPDINIEMV